MTMSGALTVLVAASTVLPAAVAADRSATAARREEQVRKAVAAVLDRETAAWNRGDLEGFVSAYAEDASFVSPTGLTRGRQAGLDRYRKRYPNKAAMGTLSLELVGVRLVKGTAGASVVARWTLSY